MTKQTDQFEQHAYGDRLQNEDDAAGQAIPLTWEVLAVLIASAAAVLVYGGWWW